VLFRRSAKKRRQISHPVDDETRETRGDDWAPFYPKNGNMNRK